ncbi:hypothetical protein [Paraburkholderia sp. LEh10]|uniref:hypothetical protein n=1 Tax=Paraburkholderia sp. LEh10 TaxID=2821353 RepID=UPI0028A92057|nr:hypothetical protein [Paraburkholderia sp. LEh10]
MAKQSRQWGISASNRHALRNADAEISNLEKVLTPDGTHSVLDRTYWRRRLYEIHKLPGLRLTQRIKLEALLSILEGHEKR